MENTKAISPAMGFSAAKVRQYEREYVRTNPYDLPEMRRYRRRIIKSEFVFSTQTQE